MKVNNKTIVGNSFAYDGCHKIYIIENDKDLEEASGNGYRIYPIEKLEKTFDSSCNLRFISSWNLSTFYVGQFEDVEFTRGEE